MLDGTWLFRVCAVALAGGTVYFYHDAGWVTGVADIRNAVNVMVGASATILGFLVSAGALLFAVSNTTLARNLQRTGHFNRLLADLFLAAGCFLIALVVGLICVLLEPAKIGETELTRLDVGMPFLVFTNVLAYMMLIPVGHKMWLLLSSLVPADPGRLE